MKMLNKFHYPFKRIHTAFNLTLLELKLQYVGSGLLYFFVEILPKVYLYVERCCQRLLWPLDSQGCRWRAGWSAMEKGRKGGVVLSSLMLALSWFSELAYCSFKQSVTLNIMSVNIVANNIILNIVIQCQLFKTICPFNCITLQTWKMWKSRHDVHRNKLTQASYKSDFLHINER